MSNRWIVRVKAGKDWQYIGDSTHLEDDIEKARVFPDERAAWESLSNFGYDGQAFDRDVADEAEEALAFMNELPSLYLLIGALQSRLRRCKPHSALWKRTWNELDIHQNNAFELQSKIREFLRKRL